MRDSRAGLKDLVAALLHMDLLPRLRYILTDPALRDAHAHILDILTVVARHSLTRRVLSVHSAN